MPPKRKKKKQICKRTCDVKKCKDKIVCIWTIPSKDNNVHYGICEKHSIRHRNIKDKFSLFTEFNVNEPGKAGGVDKFGFSLGKDHDEFKDWLITQEKEDNSESLSRLQLWKEKNKGKKKKKKYKPKGIKAKGSRETLATMKTKDVSDSDIDDVLIGILSG